MEIAGHHGESGEVEPIEIETWAETPMIVPAGKSGVGDTYNGETSDESEEWEWAGPDWQGVDDGNYPKDGCPPDDDDD